jgi:hypothetical protein
MPARLTGSGIGRAIACPPAFALPAVERASGPDALRGTTVHAYLERRALGSAHADALPAAPPEATEAERAAVDEARALCERLEAFEVPEGTPEVALAYHVRRGTARLLEVPGRSYPQGEHEVCGRVDLLVRADPTRPAVVDWKTTRWDLDVESARPQLRFYALAAARALGAERAGYAVAVITDDGAVAWHRFWLDADDLAQIAADVAVAYDRVEQARAARAAHERAYAAPWQPDVRRGKHCRYCPAMASCPGLRAELSLGAGLPAEQLDEQLIAAAYERSLAFGDARETLREAAVAWVDTHGPVRLSDGRWLAKDASGKARPRRRAA